jgi:hypothetical protein
LWQSACFDLIDELEPGIDVSQYAKWSAPTEWHVVQVEPTTPDIRAGQCNWHEHSHAGFADGRDPFSHSRGARIHIVSPAFGDRASTEPAGMECSGEHVRRPGSAYSQHNIAGAHRTEQELQRACLVPTTGIGVEIISLDP